MHSRHRVGPKDFLLLRALASPSTSCRSCKGLGSLLSYPLLAVTLSCNSAKCLHTARPAAAVEELPCRSTDAYIVDRGGPPNVDQLQFNCPTRTHVNSDLCVNDGYYLLIQCGYEVFDLFSPFRSRTLPRSTNTLPGYHADFLLSRSTLNTH